MIDLTMSPLKKFKAVLYKPERNAQPITLYFDETENRAKTKVKKMLCSAPCGSYLDLYEVTQAGRLVTTYGKNIDGSLSEMPNNS